ncbi:MAG: biotin/lipoyl-binding protein [Proteobacteria bacterium]|nr:biotin/lipoyl-binding protein [Pseudomonadota bacterium]MBU1060893.1 biotin/lipoyl-binding protein [Pseudomonadota bacterium]
MTESIRTLRVIEAPSVDLVPRVTGYGVAEASRVWEAVAEVKGIVLSVFPHLKSGVHVKAGDILIRIDPTEYELAVARLEASVARTRAEMKELTGDEENIKTFLPEKNSSTA